MTLFSLLLGLGASLGLWRVYRRARAQEARLWVDAGMLALLAALVGARTWYVGFHFEFYSANPTQALAIWQGGYAWPGAVLGGLLAVGLTALFSRRSPALVAERLAPLLGPLAAGVWLGCWPAGLAYGAVLAPTAWWGIPAPDEAGLVLQRAPLQPLAALVWLAWLAACGRAGPPRQAPLALLGLALNIGLFSLLWADPTRAWNGLRVDTWAAGALALFSLGWTAAAGGKRAA
jgi:phosphatidylglycerol:prolipoprotein diacylglycerol transferase